MPLGLPIRDTRVPRWRSSRHDLRVEVHLTLAGRRQERALHYLILPLPFLPDLLHSIL